MTHTVLEPAAGERYLGIAEWLRDFYAWPAERRQAWQRQQLAEVIRHAAERVPFYRSFLGPWPDAGTTPLEDFPTVDKIRMRRDMDAFRSEGWRGMPFISKKTSGSTGHPWRHELDRRAWAHIYAAAIHFRERVGVYYGEPVVLLGAPATLGLEESNWKSDLRHRLERHDRRLTGLDIDRASSLKRLKRAAGRRAALWYGYASTVAAMAGAALEEGVSVEPPRAIVTTAELLQPRWRAQIEAAFGPRLFDEYGCHDGGVLAQTCRGGRYHVAENVSLVEVLDGDRPCPPGVEGEVTVTNLHARVLPFIRYKVGDRAVLGEGPCPCGTPGQTLEAVTGRTADRVILPGGRELSPHTFGFLFMDLPNVRRWQVVQVDPETLRFRLEVDEGFDHREAGAIRRFVSERCGAEVGVELDTEEPIELTPTGKYKFVVRQFREPFPGRAAAWRGGAGAVAPE